MARDHMAAVEEKDFKPMSYDLYLWAEPSPVTASRALDICHRLAGGDQSATAPESRLLEFASDLVADYPRLEELTDLERPRIGVISGVGWWAGCPSGSGCGLRG